MIGPPHNDHECLGAITEHVTAMVSNDEAHLVELAMRFDDVDDLAAWIRTLPQRDDHGLADDGPKIEACTPAQRFRIDAADPNCVERAGKFVGAAERIDPSATYRMATVDTPSGLHTFPTVNSKPVVLDPRQTRNALHAGLFRTCRSAPEAVELTPMQAIDWIARLASEPAARVTDGPRRVRSAHRALRELLAGRPLCVSDVRNVIFVLALGEREARLYGPIGLRIVHSAARAVSELDRLASDRWLAAASEKPRHETARNAFGLQIGGYSFAPDSFLGSLARIGGRLAGNVGLEALKIKLATMGITPPVLNTIESELQREGLTLGPLSTPPAMLGSLGALDPVALAGRHLAGKLPF